MVESNYHEMDEEARKRGAVVGDPVSDYHGYPDIQQGMLDYARRVKEVGFDDSDHVPEGVAETIEAAERLETIMSPTPTEYAPLFSVSTRIPTYFKREDTTPVHSFKLRGAHNKMSQLNEAQREAGVLAASAGNHAQGVALSAKRLGVDATIVMPVTTPNIKVEAVKALGAEVVLAGESYSDAYAFSQELLQLAEDTTFIHPFDDLDVIAGQGTVGKEIIDVQPDVTHIFVPIGGGGLIAGIAQYVKGIDPTIRIIGVQPSDSDAMKRSVDSGERVILPEVGTFADGVAVKEVGEQTFELVRTLVDDIITVNTDEVSAAMEMFFEETRSILEPAGALAIAGAYRYARVVDHAHDNKFAVVCSGANTQLETVAYAARRTEIGRDREALFAISLPEQPGSLLQLYQSVIDGHDTKSFKYRYTGKEPAHILVRFTVEGDHSKTRFMQSLSEHGYAFQDFSHDDFAKDHLQYTGVGGYSPEGEVRYEVTFAERPGALLTFLESLGTTANISLFDYAYRGGDEGKVLIGFQQADTAQLEAIFAKTTRGFKHIDSEAAELFL